MTNSPFQEALVSWSPDGNALAFSEFTGRGGIWIVRRTDGVWGTPIRRLDRGFWPGWSLDGRELSFSGGLLGGTLGVVPVDSGPPRILMDGARGITANRTFWTANGAELIFRGHDSRGRSAVFSISASGGTPRLLAVFDDPNAATVRGGWGLHQNRMYYSAEERQSDVWVMEVERP
jgi:Tol biopolymer transport system component